MSDRLAFIEAICREPGEDTHRLVYADWLDEHGEPERAEFIRDTVWMAANHTDCPVRLADVASGRPVLLRCGSCGYCRTRRRAEGFYSRHQWFPGNYAVCFEPTPFDGDIPSGPGLTLVVRRGFISEVRCTSDDWLRHADALFWHPNQNRPCPSTAHPIEKVTLTTPASLLDLHLFWRYDVTTRLHVFTSARWPGVGFGFGHPADEDRAMASLTACRPAAGHVPRPSPGAT